MKPVVVIDKIMETAERLFYQQGYNLTGINQIIEIKRIRPIPGPDFLFYKELGLFGWPAKGYTI